MTMPGFVGHDMGLGSYGNCEESSEGCSEENRFSDMPLFEVPLVSVERTDEQKKKEEVRGSAVATHR